MGAAVVAGHAGDRLYQVAVCILIHSEKFLVDPANHLVHMAGNILFRFRIAGEVQVMVGTVGRRRMAEVAFDAKGFLKCIHRLSQVIMADVFWKYFEISFGRLVIGGAHGGDADCRQDSDRRRQLQISWNATYAKIWYLKLGNFTYDDPLDL